jgi:hypothetical protein
VNRTNPARPKHCPKLFDRQANHPHEFPIHLKTMSNIEKSCIQQQDAPTRKEDQDLPEATTEAEATVEEKKPQNPHTSSTKTPLGNSDRSTNRQQKTNVEEEVTQHEETSMDEGTPSTRLREQQEEDSTEETPEELIHMPAKEEWSRRVQLRYESLEEYMKSLKILRKKAFPRDDTTIGEHGIMSPSDLAIQSRWIQGLKDQDLQNNITNKYVPLARFRTWGLDRIMIHANTYLWRQEDRRNKETGGEELDRHKGGTTSTIRTAALDREMKIKKSLEPLSPNSRDKVDQWWRRRQNPDETPEQYMQELQRLRQAAFPEDDTALGPHGSMSPRDQALTGRWTEGLKDEDLKQHLDQHYLPAAEQLHWPIERHVSEATGKRTPRWMLQQAPWHGRDQREKESLEQYMEVLKKLRMKTHPEDGVEQKEDGEMSERDTEIQERWLAGIKNKELLVDIIEEYLPLAAPMDWTPQEMLRYATEKEDHLNKKNWKKRDQRPEESLEEYAQELNRLFRETHHKFPMEKRDRGKTMTRAREKIQRRWITGLRDQQLKEIITAQQTAVAGAKAWDFNQLCHFARTTQDMIEEQKRKLEVQSGKDVHNTDRHTNTDTRQKQGSKETRTGIRTEEVSQEIQGVLNQALRVLKIPDSGDTQGETKFQRISDPTDMCGYKSRPPDEVFHVDGAQIKAWILPQGDMMTPTGTMNRDGEDHWHERDQRPSETPHEYMRALKLLRIHLFPKDGTNKKGGILSYRDQRIQERFIEGINSDELRQNIKDFYLPTAETLRWGLDKLVNHTASTMKTMKTWCTTCECTGRAAIPTQPSKTKKKKVMMNLEIEPEEAPESDGETPEEYFERKRRVKDAWYYYKKPPIMLDVVRNISIEDWLQDFRDRLLAMGVLDETDKIRCMHRHLGLQNRIRINKEIKETERCSWEAHKRQIRTWKIPETQPGETTPDGELIQSDGESSIVLQERTRRVLKTVNFYKSPPIRFSPEQGDDIEDWLNDLRDRMIIWRITRKSDKIAMLRKYIGQEKIEEMDAEIQGEQRQSWDAHKRHLRDRYGEARTFPTMDELETRERPQELVTRTSETESTTSSDVAEN